MKIKIGFRRFVHYALILSILLIQIVILVFFYNEYFNGRKLSIIEAQLERMHTLQSMAENTRRELYKAQSFLQSYVKSNTKSDLKSYVGSLQKLTEQIYAIRQYESENFAVFDSTNLVESEIKQLDHFEKLIDTIFMESKKISIDFAPYMIHKMEIEQIPNHVKVEIRHLEDSLKKKGFFNRLKDAITGNVEVKTDTIIIKTTHDSKVDTTKLKSAIDNSVEAMQQYYLDELRNYKSRLDTRNNRIYRIYDGLINTGNNLLDVYNTSISDFKERLQNQYSEQISINNKIRRNTILGLLFLTFLVLIVLMYYTRLAFEYENDLKEANDRINQHLNFKTRVLGMLSHEIRAPLKIITLFIKNIDSRTTDSKVREYLKTIKFTINSMLIQANQILEISSEKKSEFQLTNFNLKNEIVSLLKAFEPYIESGNNNFLYNIQISDEIIVYSDSTKIHQILTNLLDNANKFTENGIIELKAIAFETTSNEVQLKVSVSDTGTGISENDLEHIFEPYYQGIVSDEVENLGVGLGLSLCKEIVENFGGEISAQSIPGEGTTIAFEIKLTKT